MITTNRINMPDTAERVLAEGHADMISMARYDVGHDAYFRHSLTKVGKYNFYRRTITLHFAWAFDKASAA